ncbi:PREDICTED: ribosomal RNA small subunit methyltransferase H [Theobroma cacao]|uniref:MraW methylase family protein isoform 1 n=2 Tax=Theobroma cacao TaxID=3641 RepID=A0A061GPR7_THECC|nr:PREDICTED: ribosomal RNA small subunit methyltransferase H [Theobroma cacao]EOY29109.1 MraW methylase family protein isoform 1 [Theobroma cacao]EOY29110.1 MraW methylase family protein isoform 1 [Theobroma cacao]
MAHFIPGCICLIEMMIDLGLESMAAKAKQMMLMMLSSSFSFSVSSLSAPASVSAVRHPTKSCALVRSACRSISTDTSKKKKKKKEKGNWNAKALEKEKRRTRSLRDCDIEIEEKEEDDSSSTSVMMQQTQTQTHVPVMLGEVLDVFSSNSKPLCSFVDCTLGAGGHASAIIQAHPELKLFIGMDVDPLALHMACSRIRSLSHSHPHPHFQAFTFLDNFRHIKSLLRQVVHPDIFSSGVDGILMDLGMSSMQVNNPERGFSVLANGPLDMRMDPQASLKAEDILNSWPDIEVGRILRDYGEESNWWLLQNKIIQARLQGGLHSTGELVDVIRSVNPRTRGGRQGWVKTATRVFQALRIAVNDELKTLEDSLYACFDCLAPGGRLAVISFHSLEDRIVKQTFLKIIDCCMESGDGSEDIGDLRKVKSDNNQNEAWIRQTIQGWNGTILTKRPLTPSEKEEGLNRRCRSAKLRVIQKVRR